MTAKLQSRAAGRPAGPWEPSPRDMEIFESLSQGNTTRTVAEKFGLSHQRISQVGVQVGKWLVPQLAEQIKQIKVSHTYSLDHIFRECMAAWERSKHPIVTEKSEVTNRGTRHTVRKKSSCGDWHFLAEAMKALREIREIWGVEMLNTLVEDNYVRAAGIPRDEYRLRYAYAKIAEYQRVIDEIEAQQQANDAEGE